MQIKRRSLSDELANRVREEIRNGKYGPGEKLPTEPELMALFEVSRSTVREAMRVLSNSGWVKVQQGLGTFVESNNVSGEPLGQRLIRGEDEDLEEVRSLLESRIVEKAAVHHTKEDIAHMRECLRLRAEFAGKGDTAACIETDLEFHSRLAHASGNPVLADLYEALVQRLKKSFKKRFKTVESFEKTQRYHVELLENIEAGNARKAIQLLHRIVRS